MYAVSCNLTAFIFCSKIVLVAIQDEGKKYMTGAAYNALRKIGAKDPFRADYRGSFALLGFTGPGKPAFIQQVRKSSGGEVC